jgi:hypothetical protein
VTEARILRYVWEVVAIRDTHHPKSPDAPLSYLGLYATTHAVQRAFRTGLRLNRDFLGEEVEVGRWLPSAQHDPPRFDADLSGGHEFVALAAIMTPVYG